MVSRPRVHRSDGVVRTRPGPHPVARILAAAVIGSLKVLPGIFKCAVWAGAVCSAVQPCPRTSCCRASLWSLFLSFSSTVHEQPAGPGGSSGSDEEYSTGTGTRSIR